MREYSSAHVSFGIHQHRLYYRNGEAVVMLIMARLFDKLRMMNR